MIQHTLLTVKAEWQKLKRTGIFWICFGAALFIPLINTLAFGFMDELFEMTGATENPWKVFIQSNFSGFTQFFFPLFLVLMVTRLVYLEHKSDTWKLMETQPVSKIALFLSKWKIAVFISLICLLMLLAFSIIGGLLVQALNSGAKMQEHAIPWNATIAIMFRFWIASLGLITVQYFLCLLIKSFAWPMGIGLFAIITGSILQGFDIMNWFPYSATALTSRSFEGSATGAMLMFPEKMSLLWTGLFLFLGYRYFRHKSFERAVFKPFPQLAKALAVIAVFAVGIWFFSRPVTLQPHYRTVIAGNLKTDKPIKQMVLLGSTINDTITVIPVDADGRFHAVLDDNFSAGYYHLKADKSIGSFYFGPKDSIHLKWEFDIKKNDFKITGTRIAENEYLTKRNQGSEIYYLANYSYNYKPQAYASKVMSEWVSSKKKLNDFKTADYIRPADDFIQLQEKLLAVKSLNLVDVVYPGMYQVYYPNDTFSFKNNFETLRKLVSFNDTSLAGFGEYRNYIIDYLKVQKNANTEPALFAALDETIQSPKIKDAVLFNKAQGDIGRILDSSRRELMVQHYMNSIHTAHLKEQLQAIHKRMNNMQKGKPAPLFVAEALNGQEFDLSKFRGRYVIIDVWATWCGPCKYEDPYFKEAAETFTSEQVAFVSLSVDEDKNAWKLDAGRKGKRVLQLWAKDGQNTFMKDYVIDGIPRFILIDPKGNIINIDLPRPSEADFLLTLRKEIPILNR